MNCFLDSTTEKVLHMHIIALFVSDDCSHLVENKVFKKYEQSTHLGIEPDWWTTTALYIISYTNMVMVQLPTCTCLSNKPKHSGLPQCFSGFGLSMVGLNCSNPEMSVHFVCMEVTSPSFFRAAKGCCIASESGAGITS